MFSLVTDFFDHFALLRIPSTFDFPNTTAVFVIIIK
jgi:hypothetical protein